MDEGTQPPQRPVPPPRGVTGIFSRLASFRISEIWSAVFGRTATRVRLAHGDWFDALPGDLRGNVGVIVSNPPYVASDDELPGEVRDWEPTHALFAGADGLDDIRRIVAEAPEWLARPGALVVEFAPPQALTVGALAYGAGFDDVMIGRDLTDRERYLVARVT